MSWILLVIWLAGAAGIWFATGLVFKHSGAWQSSRPLLAIFWPIALVGIIVVLALSLIDLAYELRADRTFGPERGE